MELIRFENFEDTRIICTSDNEIHWCCYVEKHDIYFGAKVGEGDDNYIKHKASVMIKMKEKFLKEFPEYIK